jgi:hypothetical protein
MSHKGTVSSTELGSRSGPASALSDLIDHEGESDANHPGVLGQGDALLSGTQGTLLSHAGCPQVQAEGAQGKGGQPSPASQAGTIGSTRAVPMAISAVDSRLVNRLASSLPRTG